MKTMDLHFSVRIDRPVEEVFSFMSDFRNHGKIFSANVDSCQTSQGPVKEGTTMRNIARFMGVKMEEHFVVTRFEKDRILRKESLPESSVSTTDEMLFTNENGNTRLDVHVYAEMKGFISWFAPLIMRKVNRILSRDFENLKVMLESGKQ